MKRLVDKILRINVWVLFLLLIVAAEALSVLLALVLNALFYDGTNNLIMLGAFVIPIIVAPIIIILLIITIRELRDSRLQLDRRVKDRTIELTSAVEDLEKENKERKKAEEELKITKKEVEAWNLLLERRVEEKSNEIKESHKQLIQAEKLSALGQLTAGLAHELTSPLSGLLPLLRKYNKRAEEGSEEALEMKLMLEGCEYMAKIVRDFASFSKTSSGNLEEVDLNETIKLTLGLILKHLQLKSIQVHEEYADSLPKVKGVKTEFHR